VDAAREAVEPEAPAVVSGPTRHQAVVFALMVGAFVVAPSVVYPVFLMKALCFALFACAFNLLIGYGGLLSFGHAAYLGSAGYVTAHAAKVWGWPPELATWPGWRERPRWAWSSGRSPSAGRASTSR
jgi:branched-chain amino acid transport system permease protein